MGKKYSSHASGQGKQKANKNLRLLLSFCVIFAGILLVQLYRLQVLQFDTFLALSNENRLSVIQLKPNRGKILDRNGKILATNQPIYHLNIRSNIHSSIAYEKIGELAETLNFNTNLARRTFFQRYSKTSQITNIPFAELDKEGLSQFKKISSLYPEVSVVVDNKRLYPYKQHASHILGYIHTLSTEDSQDTTLFSSPKQAKKFSHVGKSGIERFYDQLLRGEPGYTTVEVNAKGKVVRTLSHYDKKDGMDIYLNLDIALQQFTDNLMEGKKGAIIIMNSQNGEVYAATSAPFFDNNLFTTGNIKALSSLRRHPDNILLNRVSQGLYPPAKTFKAFIDLANSTLQKPHNYLKNFSFGQRTNIDLPKEAHGTLLNNPQKRKQPSYTWPPNKNLELTNEKNFSLVTPLQLTVAFSNLANRGHTVIPRLAKKKTLPPKKLTIFNQKRWKNITQTMHISLPANHTPIGKKSGKVIVGKTSTQLKNYSQPTNRPRLSTNTVNQSLFVGYAPLINPQVTLAIVLEDNQYNKQALLSMAQRIFHKFFSLN